MDELLDKVREQFESGAPSKCMLESILGRIERKHRDALEDAWSDGWLEGWNEGHAEAGASLYGE